MVKRYASVHVTVEGRCYRVVFDGDRLACVWLCLAEPHQERSVDPRSDLGVTAINLARVRRAMDGRARRSQSGHGLGRV
jgi:hypothetical protein